LLSIASKWSLHQLRLNVPATAIANVNENENDPVVSAATLTPWARLLVSLVLPLL
jgi:hypothetical protein